jgi:SAM-dependent methyltransferase
MSVFSEEYAEYYNLLYQDKNYALETEYVCSLLNKFSDKASGSLLDVGCGTGRHAAEFCRKGFDVYGIDIAEEMLTIARKNVKQANFSCQSASSYEFNQKFDFIVSLFHVMSYQNSNKDLFESLKNAYYHLAAGGLFIFDFWYGPAVLSDLPEVRVKKLENENVSVLRKATPNIDYNANIVYVNYELQIHNKKNNTSSTIKESHPMRYLFLPELSFMLNKIGFEIVHTGEWLTSEPLSKEAWNGVIVVKK